MKFPRPIIVSLVLTALVIAVGAVVSAYPSRVKGEISLEVRYSYQMCGNGLPADWTPPTWDQMTAAQRAVSYDKNLPEKIFMAGVLWRRTGDYLTTKGINLGEPTAWRDQHVLIHAGEAFKAATGAIMCRYEIRFPGVSPELAARVLFAVEHTFREHVFNRDSERTNEHIKWLETQIAKLEATNAASIATGLEFAKNQATLAASRHQLAEARENLRVIALRRTLITAKLL